MARIKIVNFDQYNPRKDRSRHYWFKVENGIIYSESLDELEADQKWFWIFLLAYAKEKQCDTFELKMKYFVKHSGVSEKKISAALEILNQNNTIEVLPDDESHLSPNGNQMSPNGCLDKRREEERREEERREEADSDSLTPKGLFEIWNRDRGPLPEAKDLTEERRKKALTQIKKYPGRQHWLDALSKLLASQFCIQEWKPSFDDYLSESKRIRALEGKYDNKLKVVGGSKTREQQAIDHNREQYERVLKGEL
jgi:hypothetical protein